MRLVLLSDTHGYDDFPVPEGDVLVHAGDLSRRGRPSEITRFAAFLSRLPHPHKVVIAGNHDRCLEKDIGLGDKIFSEVTYLLDREAIVAGLRFYGSPWQPEFMSWAFNLPRGEALRAVWSKIPNDIDVLVTHGPPFGVLDRTYDGTWVGCEEMRTALDRARPRLHVFGHIHEAAGVHQGRGTLSVNASTCTLAYEPTHPIVVVDVPLERDAPATLVSPAREGAAL